MGVRMLTAHRWAILVMTACLAATTGCLAQAESASDDEVGSVESKLNDSPVGAPADPKPGEANSEKGDGSGPQPDPWHEHTLDPGGPQPDPWNGAPISPIAPNNGVLDGISGKFSGKAKN